MGDMLEALDKTNAELCKLFVAHCRENGITPLEVCVSARARGVPKFLVCQLFGNFADCASPCRVGNGCEKLRKVTIKKCAGLSLSDCLFKAKFAFLSDGGKGEFELQLPELGASVRVTEKQIEDQRVIELLREGETMAKRSKKIVKEILKRSSS